MELNKNKFAFAAAEVLAIWYLVCALLVAMAPSLAVKLFGWMVHLVDLKPDVTFPEVIYGFVEVTILTYITAYAFAYLHNWSVKK